MTNVSGDVNICVMSVHVDHIPVEHTKPCMHPFQVLKSMHIL